MAASMSLCFSKYSGSKRSRFSPCSGEGGGCCNDHSVEISTLGGVASLEAPSGVLSSPAGFLINWVGFPSGGKFHMVSTDLDLNLVDAGSTGMNLLVSPLLSPGCRVCILVSVWHLDLTDSACPSARTSVLDECFWVTIPFDGV